MDNYTTDEILNFLSEEMANFEIRLSSQLDRIKEDYEWNALGVYSKLNQAMKENFKTYQDRALQLIEDGMVQNYLDTCKGELKEAIAYIGAKQQALRAAGQDIRMEYENREYNSCFTIYEDMTNDFFELENKIKDVEMER